MLKCGPEIGGGKHRQVFLYCQRERFRENMSERACQIEHVRECQSQIVRESASESMSETVSETVIVRLSEIAYQSCIGSEQVACQDCQRQC